MLVDYEKLDAGVTSISDTVKRHKITRWAEGIAAGSAMLENVIQGDMEIIDFIDDSPLFRLTTKGKKTAARIIKGIVNEEKAP